MADEARFDAATNTLLAGDRRLVFHCHHYNVFLQRSIDEALGPDAAEVQRDAAAEASRGLLEGLYAKDGGQPVAARLERARAMFGSLGFGLAELSPHEAGVGVKLKTSHYAVGWQAKFGRAGAPVCHFAVGYWRGAVAAAMGLSPERVGGTERRCAACGVERDGCELSIEVR